MHPIFVPRAIVQAHKLHLLCIACIACICKTMPGKPECTDDVEKCIFALRVHLFSDCIQCRGNLEEEHLLVFPMMGAHYFRIGMTQLLLLGKFEYTGGPIFKVVLEC